MAGLIALAAIDYDLKLLPNKIVYPLAAWGLIATLLVDRGDLVENLAAGAGAFAFLLLAVILYPRGMGMGDVKLSGAMGLYLGLSVIPALLVAFLSGSIVGLDDDRPRGRSRRARRLSPSGCSSPSEAWSRCSPGRS